MSAPAWVKIVAAFLPIALSPIAVYCGQAAQGCYFFGVLFGAVFGIALVLPYRRPA